jgi:hypothetical protein
MNGFREILFTRPCRIGILKKEVRRDMVWWKKRSAWERELKAVLKAEEAFRNRQLSGRESILNRVLTDKVPPKLDEKLRQAFYGAFSFLFANGTGMIEKMYGSEAAERQYKMNAYAAGLKESRKSLRAFSKKAAAAGSRNLVLAGAEGLGLGLLGVGLPDSPLFTAMIFKSLYELGSYYGFGHEEEEEKYWILLLIQGALTYGGEFLKAEEECERFIEHGTLPESYQQKDRMEKTCSLLSGELLYMKFLQGVPVAGVLGGACDVIYLNRIQSYAKIKYRKRFLLKWKRELWRERGQKEYEG